MSDLATAYVQLQPSLRGAGRTIQAELGGMGAPAGQAMGKGLTGGLSSAMGGIAKVVGGVALLDFAKQGISAGLSTASGLEQAKISFETMLGSAQKADSFLKDMAAFAAKTPFEMPDLQTAASSLISVGVQSSKVIPIMTTLGDVTSGMGTGSEGIKRATVALQQMNAAGKITGEDLNQLRDAGIPVYDLLAAAMGKSKAEIVDMAQKGKLGKDALDKMMGALESGKGLERFSGLMDKQSQSLDGMLSSLKDAAGLGLAAMLQPLMPLLKDGIGLLTSFAQSVLPGMASGVQWFIGAVKSGFGSALPTIQSVAGSIGSGLGYAIQQIGPELSSLGSSIKTSLAAGLSAARPVIEGLGVAIGNAFRWITDNRTIIISALAGIAAGFIAYKTVTTIIKSVQIATKLWAGTQAALNAVMALNPVGLVIASLVALGVGLYVAYQRSETFRNAVNSAASAISGAWQTAVSWFQSTALPVLQSVWNGIATGAQWLWTNVLQPVWAGIQATIGNAISYIQGIVTVFTSVLSGNWSGAWSGIQQMASAVWSQITTVASTALTVLSNVVSAALPAIVGFFQALPGQILSALSALGGFLLSVGTSALRALLGAVVSGGTAVIGFMLSLPGRALSAVASLVPKLLSIGVRALAALGGAVTSGLIQVVGFLAGLPGRAISAVASLVPQLASKGAAALSAMAGKVSAGVSTVMGHVQAIPGKITGALSGIPAQMGEIGRNIVSGLGNAIRNGASAVMDAARALADKIPGPIKKVLGIHSPSRVMYQLGTYTVQGFQMALVDGVLSVTKAGQKLGQAALHAASGVNLGAVLGQQLEAVQRAAAAAAVPSRNAAAASANLTRARDAVARLKASQAAEDARIATGLAKLRAAHAAQDLAATKRIEAAKAKHNRSALAAAQAAKRNLDAAQTKQLADLNANRARVNARQKAQLAAAVNQQTAAQKRLTSAQAAAKQASDALSASQKALAERQKDLLDAALKVSDKFSQSYGMGGDVTDWVANLRTGASEISAFQMQLEQLRGLGLSGALVEQIQEAGVLGGGEMAAQIIRGGKATVAMLNDASSALQASADQMGLSSAMQQARRPTPGVSQVATAPAREVRITNNIVTSDPEAAGRSATSKIAFAMGGR